MPPNCQGLTWLHLIWSPEGENQVSEHYMRQRKDQNDIVASPVAEENPDRMEELELDVKARRTWW